MALYVGITIWFFFLLLLGLRPDSVQVAETWPKLPEDKKIRRNYYIVSALALASFLFLWFLTAFRSSEIGNDTFNYMVVYKYAVLDGLDYGSVVEVGYQLLNILIGKFVKLDFHLFLIVMAILMYGGVGVYIFKYSRNTAVSVCLFFGCFFSVFASMLRQGLAMIIVLYGYQLLKNRKRIPAAILFLLATAIHLSALVSFLLFVDLKLFQKKWFVFPLAIACAIFSRSGLMVTLVDAIVPKYTHFFTSKYASTGWLAITYYLLFYGVIYYLISESITEENRQDRIVALNFTLLLVFTAFGYAVNIFDRVAKYFLLIGLTEIPNMLYRGKVKHFRLWLLGICAVTMIMFILVLIYRPGWNHLYPYEFWK